VKFRSDGDKILFLLEMGANLEKGIDIELDEQMLELFLKRRREKTFELKDFRKAQTQKHNWRTRKLKYLKGINRFHRSIAGKKFHRSLSRFLLTRESYNRIDVLKAASSLKTHLYLDFEYYRRLDEAIDYEIFTESLVETINALELDILQGKELNPDDYVGLLEALNAEDIYKSCDTVMVNRPTFENYIEQIKSDFIH
jgi:hypothetical protein